MTSEVMPPFVANDYRKQVLAPILRRGGDPRAGDAFELYALPLEAADLPDPTIVARLDEVWGFWQRHRDQPKYRVLVGQLVAEHEERSAPLRTREQRLQLAQQIRAYRETREQTRFEALDLAIRRLVDRYRGIPDDKVEGLCELAAADHIGREEALRRMRRHRRIAAVGSDVGRSPGAVVAQSPSVSPASSPGAPVPVAQSPGAVVAAVDPAIAERARQVRDLLDELGRHADRPAPTTLFDLLDLPPDAAPAQIGDRARMWRARAGEMPVGRTRAVIDELLAHVRQLLESGPAVRGGYLDAVAAEVREQLRPRMRAAILVEDALLPDDRYFLTDEAIARGLDHGRAARVISELAAESTADSGRSAPGATRSNPVEDALRAARTALRAGRCAEAGTLVDRARSAVGDDPADALAAVVAEIDEVIAAARLRWRAAVSAYEAGRHAEALGHLEHLRRTASDLPYPGARRFDLDELIERSRAAVAEADRLVAETVALAESDRTDSDRPDSDRADSDRADSDRVARLLEAIARCAEHPEAMAQLASIPVGAPASVRAVRIAAGVEVTWEPSATPAVRYRVVRIDGDGSRRVVGRTAAASIIDGGVAGDETIPAYVVTAHHTGRSSAEVRSGEPPTPVSALPVPADQPLPTGVPAPGGLVVRPGPTGVVIEWDPVPGATYKVTRLGPDGSERVVGRTAAPTIEDGGAPPGCTPVYEVIALRDGDASIAVRSDGG